MNDTVARNLAFLGLSALTPEQQREVLREMVARHPQDAYRTVLAVATGDPATLPPESVQYETAGVLRGGKATVVQARRPTAQMHLFTPGRAVETKRTGLRGHVVRTDPAADKVTVRLVDGARRTYARTSLMFTTEES